MTVTKENPGVEIDGQDENPEQIPPEFAEAVKTKYLSIEKFCDNAEHFDGVIQELVLFEVVLMQINQIFCDTLYSKESTTLSDASKEAVRTLQNTFALEFVDQSLAKEALTALPDLGMAVSWVSEMHSNIAKQLFTEDFAKEVLEPSYDKIAEAIIEVSEGEQVNVEDIDVEVPSETEIKKEGN